jgi:hypothetical protein
MNPRVNPGPCFCSKLRGMNHPYPPLPDIREGKIPSTRDRGGYNKIYTFYKNQDMKILYSLLFITFCSLSFTECKKSDNAVINDTVISYPASGKYGINIISLADGATVISNSNYSFSANVGKSAVLKIIMINCSNCALDTWYETLYANKGWIISAYNNQTLQQEFNCEANTSADLEMGFKGSWGTCRIDIFENNAQTPTVSKELIWQETKNE